MSEQIRRPGNSGAVSSPLFSPLPTLSHLRLPIACEWPRYLSASLAADCWHCGSPNAESELLLLRS